MKRQYIEHSLEFLMDYSDLYLDGETFLKKVFDTLIPTIVLISMLRPVSMSL